MQPGHDLDPDALLRIAREKSAQARATLTQIVNDLYSGTSRVLTPTERQLMEDILVRLIGQVEASVRKLIAERLADRPDASHELVVALAGDEIGVAYPLLLKSKVLRDDDLIEIVQQRTMEHQLAVAARPGLGEGVSDALVETDNADVIRTLLDNPSARISERTMGRLIEDARTKTAYQAPLVRRSDLSPELARRLYWAVSAALRLSVVRKFHIDPAMLDESIRDAAAAFEGSPAEPEPAAPAVAPGSLDLGSMLVTSLRNGEVGVFVTVLSKTAKLRSSLLRRMLFEPGGEGLAIVCKGIGIDRADFAEIFLRCRQGRIGFKSVDDDELRNVLVFFDRITPRAAQKVLERWQLDREYLNALRLLEEGAGAP